MGCDIHLVLEKRHDGKWVGINTFAGHESRSAKGWTSPVARERNYDRFAALAGVRGDGPEPRGVPEDLSETTALLIEDWGEDGHSHSWLPLKQAAAVWLKTEWREDEKKSNDFMDKYPESHFFGIDCSDTNSPDDYRVVFWFDN